MKRLTQTPTKHSGRDLHPHTPTTMHSSATLASTRSIPYSTSPQALYQVSPVANNPYLAYITDEIPPDLNPDDLSDEFQDDEPRLTKVAPDSERAVIDAAREMSARTGRKPDFVIKNPGTDHITVNVGDDGAGDLVYKVWDDTHGYWIIEDNEDISRVVRYFEKEKHYRVCTGRGDTYEKHPTAWPMNRIDHFAAAKAAKPVKAVAREPSTHGLRERKKAQLAPYTTDKIKHNRQRAGKEIESDELDTTVHTQKKRKSVERDNAAGTRKSSRLSSDPSVSSSVLGEHSVEEVAPTSSVEDKLSMTVLYIKRESERVPTPLCPNCTLEELFDKVDQTWGLAGQSYYLILTFPWKHRFSDMVLRRTLQDGWDTLRENIRRAPCWAKGEPCEVGALIQPPSE